MENEEIIYPEDKIIASKMASGCLIFDTSRIVAKIPVTSKKTGEQLFLYKLKNSANDSYGYMRNNIPYYLISEQGDVVAGACARTYGTFDKPTDEVVFDYTTNPDFRSKGYGTFLLSLMVKETFDNRSFDKLPGVQYVPDDSFEPAITKIKLDIAEDNFASQIVANNNGFRLSQESGHHELSYSQYKALNQTTSQIQ